MSANPDLMKAYLKSLLKSLGEKAAKQPQHCRREDGTERKWFDTC